MFKQMFVGMTAFNVSIVERKASNMLIWFRTAGLGAPEGSRAVIDPLTVSPSNAAAGRGARIGQISGAIQRRGHRPQASYGSGRAARSSDSEDGNTRHYNRASHCDRGEGSGTSRRHNRAVVPHRLGRCDPRRRKEPGELAFPAWQPGSAARGYCLAYCLVVLAAGGCVPRAPGRPDLVSHLLR